MSRKNFVRPFFITIALLAIPLFAKVFSEEMNWGVEDFVAAFVLLFIIGVSYEFIAKHATTTKKKILTACVLLAILFLAWAELAVGIFD